MDREKIKEKVIEYLKIKYGHIGLFDEIILEKIRDYDEAIDLTIQECSKQLDSPIGEAREIIATSMASEFNHNCEMFTQKISKLKKSGEK